MQICLTEEKGALSWPPLSADICDQTEETVYICRKKKLDLREVGEWRMRRDRNIIFVLYHETCNFTLT